MMNLRITILTLIFAIVCGTAYVAPSSMALADPSKELGDLL
jgi:hypothetical protein